MFNLMKKTAVAAVLASTLAVSAMSAAAPASAMPGGPVAESATIVKISHRGLRRHFRGPRRFRRHLRGHWYRNWRRRGLRRCYRFLRKYHRTGDWHYLQAYRDCVIRHQNY